MTVSELRNANDLFRDGTEHMRMARAEIEDVQEAQRDELVDATTSGVLITVPLALVSLMLAMLAWRNHRQILLSEARLQLAVKETNHRVKNNLQVINALVDMHRMDTTDQHFQKALAEIGGQVKAMASVHDLLSRSDKAGEILSDSLLERLVELMVGSSPLSVDLEADAVPLDSHQATALALITNELLLNAAKHGASCARVCLSRDGETATLTVEDNGPGFPKGFRVEKDSNLGLAMVNTLVGHDLRGGAQFPPDGGSRVEMRFPVRG
jgi:two-component sensor histidine kinase